MEYDVTIDRFKYIGGSDIPIIMGISPFKTRYQLLLEKAELANNDFEGNIYTTYGKELEPKIRAYLNYEYSTDFEPNRIINGDFRAHTDGFDGERVIEIKTTSHIYDTVNEYKIYLVQLIKYMEENKVDKGILAVYERPENFDTTFDVSRLHIYEIDMADYEMLLKEVNAELDRFRADLERLKENPLLCEEDFQPNELVVLSNKVLAFENQLASYKAIEQEYKQMKQQLFEAMLKYDVKSWETVNGVKITRVDGTEATVEMVKEFDEAEFKKDYPVLYKGYCKEVEKKKNARAGYVKITLPKG